VKSNLLFDALSWELPPWHAQPARLWPLYRLHACKCPTRAALSLVPGSQYMQSPGGYMLPSQLQRHGDIDVRQVELLHAQQREQAQHAQRIAAAAAAAQQQQRLQAAQQVLAERGAAGSSLN
jgi:hypothetical protein